MRIHVLPLLLTLACALPHASAQNAGTSSASDRAHALALADDLEANPLGPAANEKRNQLTTFLLRVPDIHVSMCSSLLGDLAKTGKDSNILVMQPTFSSIRYAIEHGGGNGSSVEQYQAGVLGTLKTYENMVRVKPEDRQPVMDELLKKRANGTLRAYIKVQFDKSCKIKGPRGPVTSHP